MEDKIKFITMISLICALLGGCSDLEQRKVKLLEQVEHNFDLPEAHFELGQIYEIQRNWELSNYYYDFALGFDPSNSDSKGKEVKAMSDKAAAKATAEKYIGEVSKSSVESLRLGMSFHKEALDDYALDAYKQALTLSPNSSRTNRQIGNYYLLKHDNANAKAYLKRSFEINPGQRDVANRLGQLGVNVEIPKTVPPEKTAPQSKK
jgi:tetratricopeptide (TPR) repeat protein